MYKYTSCWLIEVLLVSFISSQTRAISDIQHRSLISSVFCLLVARAGGRLHRERPVVQRAERARPALSAPLRAQRAAHHAPRPLRALPPARVRVLLGGAACCSISSLPLVFTYGRFKWMMPFSLPIAGLHERVRAAARAEFDRNGRHRVVQLEHQSVARRVRPPRTFNHNSSELYLNDELYFGGSVPVSALCARSAGTSFGDFGGSARVRWRICSHCFSSPFGTASSLVRYLLNTYCTRTAQYAHISNVQMQVVATWGWIPYAGYLMAFGLEFVIVNTERQVRSSPDSNFSLCAVHQPPVTSGSAHESRVYVYVCV